MQKPARIAALLLALPGVVALFLPFTQDTSPLDEILSFGQFFNFSQLAAPAFLAIPIVAWQTRRLFVQRLSVSEITAAYVLSTGAIVSVLAFTVLLLKDEPDMPGFGAAAIGLCWALVVANALVLMRNLAKGVTREAAAEVFLLGGYLPNAVFCLILFGRGQWSRLEIGALFVLIACVGYVASIVLALRSEDARRSPAATPLSRQS